MLSLFAETVIVHDRFAGPVAAWSFGEMLIALIILGGAVGITLIALRQFGLTIPPWLLQMLGIVAVVVVAVMLLKVVLGM